jgi:diguanylate cyclase (GGDEF)-like protein
LFSPSPGAEEVSEFVGQRKDGSRFPLEMRLSAWEAAGRHHSVIVRDISSRKRSEERIHYLALHDGLTGLANRTQLCDAIKGRITSANDHTCFAVFVIDLDNFKQLNDTLGHDGGDKLLCHFSRELVRALGTQATTARLGGDEFAVVVEMVGDQRDQVAQMIRNILGDGTRSTFIDGRSFRITASMGSALFRGDGGTVDDLLCHADLALHRAKQLGRALHIPYNHTFKESLERLRVLEADLSRAVDANELELHYQPQLSLVSGKLAGTEALMRWRHKERGLVMPDEFLPVLSNCTLSAAVGEWVLRTACRQAAAWHAAGHSLCMGVNLFPSQFTPDLPQQIATVLHETGLPPHLLEIEITENVLPCDTIGRDAVEMNQSCLQRWRYRLPQNTSTLALLTRRIRSLP